MFGWLYYLAVKHKWVAYLVAPLFLVDFYLTWRHTERVLRGDTATNISQGLALVSGLLALPIKGGIAIARIIQRGFAPLLRLIRLDNLLRGHIEQGYPR